MMHPICINIRWHFIWNITTLTWESWGGLLFSEGNASSRLATWYSLDFVKYTKYILTMSCATNNVDLRQDHGRRSTPPPFHHRCFPSDKALASQVSLRCQPFRSFKARVLVCWPGKILTGIQIPRWKVCMGLRESISNPERWCCESATLNMPANLENSAVATGLEKVSFHSKPKERQRKRMLKLPHNSTHFTH